MISYTKPRRPDDVHALFLTKFILDAYPGYHVPSWMEGTSANPEAGERSGELRSESRARSCVRC